MALFKEFRDFALRGNVVDMAVGIIIGASFSAVVKSMVADMLMPPLGLLLGNMDFSRLFVVLREGHPLGPYASIAQAHTAGAVTLNYGSFVDTMISFSIIAACVFLLVRAMNRLQNAVDRPPPAAVATKPCPYCDSTLSVKATRCAFCTSALP